MTARLQIMHSEPTLVNYTPNGLLYQIFNEENNKISENITDKKKKVRETPVKLSLVSN